MPTYAFNSEEDFRRAARAIVRSERTPVNKRAERGRYPIGVDGGGGGGRREYVLTTLYGEDNVAAYRGASLQTGYLITDAEQTDVELLATRMSGVACTGQVVLVETLHGEKYITGGAAHHFFKASPVDTIEAGDSGEVTLHYMDENGDGQSTGPVMAINTLDRAVVADQVVYVWFGSSVFGSGFYIQSAECPS